MASLLRMAVASVAFCTMALGLAPLAGAVPIDGSLIWTNDASITGALQPSLESASYFLQHVDKGVYYPNLQWTFRAPTVLLERHVREETNSHLIVHAEAALGQGGWEQETYEFRDAVIHVTSAPAQEWAATALVYAQRPDGTVFHVEATDESPVLVRSVDPAHNLFEVPRSAQRESARSYYAVPPPDGRLLELKGSMGIAAFGNLDAAVFGWTVDVREASGRSISFQTGVTELRDSSTGLSSGSRIEYVLLQLHDAEFLGPATGGSPSFFTPLLAYVGHGIYPQGYYSGASEQWAPATGELLPVGGTIWLGSTEGATAGANEARVWGEANWKPSSVASSMVPGIAASTWPLLAVTAGLLLGSQLLPGVGRFLRTGALALYARLTDKELDNNHTRQRILQLIREQPGLNLSQIVKVLAIGWGTVAYHVQILRRQGRIRELRFLNRVCFFANMQGEGQQMQTVLLRQPNYREVMVALASQPGLSQREIASRTGHARQYISRLVAKMERAGLLRAEPSTAGRRYFPLDGVILDPGAPFVESTQQNGARSPEPLLEPTIAAAPAPPL